MYEPDNLPPDNSPPDEYDLFAGDPQFYRPNGAPLSPRSQKWSALTEAWVLLGGVLVGAGIAALVLWAFGRLG